MRKILLTSFTLFLVACVSTPELPPSSSLGNVQFIGDLKTGKATKLLHWSDNKFYMAQEDGSVQVLNESGQLLATLPAKDAKGEQLLERPAAVTTHGDTIYVVDSDTDQVVMFSHSGTVKGKFGGSDGDMQLSHPRGIAIHDGIVYVADSGNGKVQLFGINGVFLHTLNINDNAHNQKAAEKREIPFELDEPIDIELDSLGRIYALDEGDQLVKVYNQRGHYINNLPTAGEPVDVSISNSGIFVANLASYTINKYGFDYRLDFTFGSKGKGRAQFQSMSGLAVNNSDKIFIGDNEGKSVHRFAAEGGQPLLQWQRLATPPSMEWVGETKSKIGKFAWNGGDRIFAINRDKQSIVKIEDGVVIDEFTIKGVDPVSIAVYPDGNMLVIDKEEMRIVKLSSSGEMLSSFGSEGSGAGQFDEPVDIAISSTGLIFVADSDNGWIQVFNDEGIFLNVIRDTVNPEVKLDEPTAIALDPQDNLYVLDKGENSISIFTAKGNPKANFIRYEDRDAPGNFDDPIDLMVTHNELFLLDDDRVKVYNKKGEYLRSWGVSGRGIGQFDRPVSISGKDPFTFAIADSENERLQQFSTLHKPRAVGSVSADGGMHAAKIKWAANTLPHIDHYRIYRAESEGGRFVPVGSSKEASYHDKELDADLDYYYRVSAVTNRGYESTLDEVVAASTSKYTPHPVTNLEATPSAWQVKLNWTPLDDSYSSSYIIYKKSAEGFSKIGESTEGEFVVSSLNPENDYTFYVTAISSDNIESRKMAATATTHVATSTPLEIDVLEMTNVFSNTYKIYEQDGMGRIKLTNNTGDTMQNIKVGFTLKNFMDFPTGSQIDQLAPGESAELTLKAVFNNNILNVTEDTPIQTELTASYLKMVWREALAKTMRLTFMKSIV